MAATLEEIEAVYRREFERFLRVASSIVGDEEAGYDAVQEAFAQAIRHRRGFGRRGPLEAWLWRTVVNSARKARRPRSVAVEASRNGPAPDDPFELRGPIADLPERQRLVVFLRYYADLDYGAIADTLGIAPGTVAATLNAAHAALRRQLEEVPQ